MYVLRGRLTPEIGALLMRALEAAGDALFRERGSMTVEDRERAVAQRRADALGLLAERALAAGFGSAATDPSPDAAQPASQRAPISGTRAQRYHLARPRRRVIPIRCSSIRALHARTASRTGSPKEFRGYAMIGRKLPSPSSTSA